jgi:hypothetical protein
MAHASNGWKGKDRANLARTRKYRRAHGHTSLPWHGTCECRQVPQGVAIPGRVLRERSRKEDLEMGLRST